MSSARHRQWTVRGDEGPSLGDVLRVAGADAQALAQGRVFVGAQRARQLDLPVTAGQVVTVAPAVSHAHVELVVLAEQPDMVAVDKPAGLATIPDHHGDHSLLHVLAAQLGVPPAELHPTSRLDREVSGVVIFARTPQAAGRLRQAREQHAYARRYLAIVARAPQPEAGVWQKPIGRASDPRHRRTGGRDAVASETRYATVARARAGAVESALLAVAPLTGRTHQIRVHAADGGAPLLGDHVYGGPRSVTLREGPRAGSVVAFKRIALHAARVEVPDGRGGRLTVESAPPAELRQIWETLGGEPSAWDTALSCSACPLDMSPPPVSAPRSRSPRSPR